MPAAQPVTHRFDGMTPAARVVWAKSGEPEGHGLLAHILDVAAVAERLLIRESVATRAWAAGELDIDAAGAARAIAALVGLHDLGKAIAGFQHKWPQGQAADEAAGLPFSMRLLDADLHDRASNAVLPPLLAVHVGSRQRAQLLASAVAAHHGFVFDQMEVRDAVCTGEPAAWPQVRREIFDAYWQTLNPQASGVTLPTTSALAWLAGLTSVADWIGSNVEWFPPAERDSTFAGHHANALDRAEAALDAIGWPAHRALLDSAADTDTLLAAVMQRPGVTARPLQTEGERLLQGVREPVLMIVEAPMGEGKTELAFLAHLRLQQTLGHRGLYIGLPTQATGNAMFDRTLAFLRAFDHMQPLDIQLAHGGAMLQDERILPLRGINHRREDGVASSAWFAQRRRPLLSPYGVGTIDQALLSALNVQHHFVRVWGLSNRVVVLDEVHAYDTYTSTLIEALLRWLKACGCSVVLMSATLPRSKRAALLAAWAGRGATEVPLLEYPRVLLAEGGTVRGASFTASVRSPIELAALGEGLDEVADCAVALAERGGCGAVVVNTVDRAQRLFGLLRARLNDRVRLLLFHARYPGDERLIRERDVLATFGRDAQRPEAALLIATQVVEQSLDIDFDFLVSDLAPMDLLLQRAGRLHRHERCRPAAHAVPRLVIAGGLALRVPELKATAWAAVYDEWLLLRTWAFVSRATSLRLPHDIDRLVQAVYESDELPAGVPPEVLRRIDVVAQGNRLAEQTVERQRARHAMLDARLSFDELYGGKPRGNDEGDFPGVRNVTRLGPESLVVVPVHVQGDRWQACADGEPFDPAAQLDASTARVLVTRQLRLARRDLVMALKATALPPAFADHPWLKHARPLPLDQGRWRHGNLEVRLDPELGIVYSTVEDHPDGRQ